MSEATATAAVIAEPIALVNPAETQRSSMTVLRRSALLRRSLGLADLSAALLAVFIVLVSSSHHQWYAAMLTAPLVVLVAKLSGLYDRDELVLRKSTIDELPAIVRLSLISTLVLLLAEGSLDRTHTLTLLACLLVFLSGGRAIARAAVASMLPPERCLVVGHEGMIDRLEEKLSASNAECVGFLPVVDRRTGVREGHVALDQALVHLVRTRRVHRVIIAAGNDIESEQTLELISRAKTLGAHVSIVPRMFEVIGSSVEFDHVDGMVMLGVHRFGLTRSSYVVKRTMDIAGATVALLLAAPVMLAAALLIKLESPGPVLFRQRRVGRNGKVFTLLKFRSMRDGADAQREALAAINYAGDGMFKAKDDPRITRVGRVLRRASFDELPQLLNVLRGEMSLVGPRPLVENEDKRIVGWHRRRLHLTPGLTGPWQVLGSGDQRVPLRDMVTIDYLYAANWSLWADLKILLRTALHVCCFRGV